MGRENHVFSGRCGKSVRVGGAFLALLTLLTPLLPLDSRVGAVGRPALELPNSDSTARSRNGIGTSGVRTIGTVDGAGAPLTLSVSNLVSTGVERLMSVSLNVTAIGLDANPAGGYVTVYSCGDIPNASNLNFVPGQITPNAVLAPVSSDGTICLHVFGRAHIIVDVNGVITSSD